MGNTFARGALLVAVLLAPAAVLATKPTRTLDLATPEGALQAFRKVQCSTEDGHAVVYYWKGEVYSRIDGEPDRLLFGFEGMNIRQCSTVTDPARGRGFRQVSREVLYYEDPATGAILDEWKNPWTGDTLAVAHVANDPVNFRTPIFPKSADGKPYRAEFEVLGDHWWGTTTVPLFYRNPLAGDYQDYVGGMYHATEMFNFFGKAADLVDADRPSADVDVAWSRVSQWLPWMKMRGRPGLVYFNGAGRKLGAYADLPQAMRRAIESRNPQFVAPPPADDARPNETSWGNFRKAAPPPETK